MNLMNTLYVTLIQSFLALFITLFNAILQIIAYSQLGNTSNGMATIETPTALQQISTARQMLLASFSSQLIAFVLLGIVIFFVLRNREKFKEQMNILVSLSLFISTFLMFIGGVVGAIAAGYLQCYRTNTKIDFAWRMSTITALTGILGSGITLLIQGFLRRDKTKKPQTIEPSKRVKFTKPPPIRRTRKIGEITREAMRRQQEAFREKTTPVGVASADLGRKSGGTYTETVRGSNYPTYNPEIDREKYKNF